MRGGSGMATTRAALQRYARARGGLAALHQCSQAVPAAGVGNLAGQGQEQGVRSPQDDARRGRARTGRRVAAGAFSLSFAASTMSVAFAKERVADRFAPNEVVLYQYDACPFCNKLKGAFLQLDFGSWICSMLVVGLVDRSAVLNCQ